VKRKERYTNLVIPGFSLAVDNGGSETPSGVDAGAGDRNRGQVNHEDRKSNRERCQNLKFKTSTQRHVKTTHNKRAFVVKNYYQTAQLQEINFRFFAQDLKFEGPKSRFKQLQLDPNSLNVPKTTPVKQNKTRDIFSFYFFMSHSFWIPQGRNHSLM